MGDFSDASHHTITPPDFLPPKSFVSRITTLDSPSKTWLSRVKAIETHFQKQMFFHIGSVKRKGKVIGAVYSQYNRSSHFPLKDENGYQVEVSFYDPKGGVSGLSAENSNEDAKLNVPTTHRIAAERDTTSFELDTRSLSTRHQIAFTVLKEREPSGTDVATPAPTTILPDPTTAPATGVIFEPTKPVFDIHLEWS